MARLNAALSGGHTGLQNVVSSGAESWAGATAEAARPDSPKPELAAVAAGTPVTGALRGELAAVSVERDSAVASLHSAREETARIKSAAREREAMMQRQLLEAEQAAAARERELRTECDDAERLCAEANRLAEEAEESATETLDKAMEYYEEQLTAVRAEAQALSSVAGGGEVSEALSSLHEALDAAREENARLRTETDEARAASRAMEAEARAEFDALTAQMEAQAAEAAAATTDLVAELALADDRAEEQERTLREKDEELREQWEAVARAEERSRSAEAEASAAAVDLQRSEQGWREMLERAEQLWQERAPLDAAAMVADEYAADAWGWLPDADENEDAPEEEAPAGPEEREESPEDRKQRQRAEAQESWEASEAKQDKSAAWAQDETAVARRLLRLELHILRQLRGHDETRALVAAADRAAAAADAKLAECQAKLAKAEEAVEQEKARCAAADEACATEKEATVAAGKRAAEADKKAKALERENDGLLA
eukprot:COSAG04_NODE_4677_length_1953_cov_1.805825_2_plen_492_part_00